MSPSPTAAQAMSAADFIAAFCRVPGPGGRLVPLQLYAAQLPLLAAWDARDPLTGLPLYDRLAALWPKKAGKSTAGGALGVHELVVGTEADREIIIAASDYEQSRNVVFASASRIVKRHPWLAKHVRCLADTLIYKETVTDPRTGGRHVQEHIMRAVAGRDARSLHGSNATLVIFDEYWTFPDYGIVEALAASPARRYSRTLILTYAGLRSAMRTGNPLWDVWQAWKAGTDPRMFVSYIGGPDGWRSVPWITPRFIDSQRRQFAAVPSKFRRLFQNEWTAGDESSFLAAEEIADATDPLLDIEPDSLPANVETSGGLDLGIVRDWGGFLITRIVDGKLTVVAVRFWRGTHQKPVSLMLIEDTVVELAQRFNLARLTIDQWQGVLLAERLRLRLPHCDIQTLAITPAIGDRFATSLKGLFASRLIKIPNHPELIEQLETLRGTEQKRRDLIRFDSGRGPAGTASAHDDLVMALMLSADAQEDTIGRAILPASFRECYRAQSMPFNPLGCYLMHGSFFPPGNDASCGSCPGHRYVRQSYGDHVARGGERMPTREFRTLFVQDNDFVGRVRMNAWADRLGL